MISHNTSRRWGGVVVTESNLNVISSLRVQLPAVHCWISTWMGDRLWAGKPSRYVTGHLGQLSLPSLQGR